MDNCPMNIHRFIDKEHFLSQWSLWIDGLGEVDEHRSGRYELVEVTEKEFNRLLYIHELVS